MLETLGYIIVALWFVIEALLVYWSLSYFPMRRKYLRELARARFYAEVSTHLANILENQLYASVTKEDTNPLQQVVPAQDATPPASNPTTGTL